ncbi:MAG: acetylglutamate kinase [bacterium]
MIDLFRAAPHVVLHRGRVVVVKIGGAALAKPAVLRSFARQIAVVQALGSKVVVVHGGGPQTDEMERLLGDTPRHVDGRRVTSAAALRALRLATAGELHGDVVAALAAEGARAVGVSGASAGLLVASRRPPVETSEGVVDYGEVGDLRSVDPAPLLALLDAGFVPVVSPPVSDGKGGFLNVNADVAAARLAVALGAAKLMLVTDVAGILADASDPRSFLSTVSLDQLDALAKSGALRGGMMPKAASIRAALLGGVERVHVVSGADGEAILAELYTNHGAGTLVTREAQTVPAEDENGAGATAQSALHGGAAAPEGALVGGAAKVVGS